MTAEEHWFIDLIDLKGGWIVKHNSMPSARTSIEGLRLSLATSGSDRWLFSIYHDEFDWEVTLNYGKLSISGDKRFRFALHHIQRDSKRRSIGGVTKLQLDCEWPATVEGLADCLNALLRISHHFK
jgi:hypothetical protein